MYRSVAKSILTTISKTNARFKSQERTIYSSIFNGILNQSAKKLASLKREKSEQFTQQATFSTSRSWNPFYARKTSYERILEVDGNKNCPDCSSTDVCYVSTLNGGVYCPVCAGIHRELGTHPDFVALNNEINVSIEDMQFYESMGNNYVNYVYEAALDVVGADKPTITSTRGEISNFIKQKYMECSFSVSRYDRPATENVLYFISNMKARGNLIPDLREKTNERVGSTYSDIMREAFDSPYVLQMAE
ncbi:arf-GAP with coiled-coil, ANK repeat and PH domain-containing protein 2-like [Rhopilema esculentum]|uniref:arf-GAP with coiled-coil, ANK repeat and PH domain-containing protein 2-like n=1 Tax=Rhopilema esculentum TaxID=499914 RepID=UPI0031CED822